MITGVHAVVFSPDAAKARAFFADVLNLPSADAGGGWLIFALPPAELAVHPSDSGSRHELYLMCDDIRATLAELRSKGVEAVGDISDQGWACWPPSGCPTVRSSPSISRDTRHQCSPDSALPPVGWLRLAAASGARTGRT